MSAGHEALVKMLEKGYSIDVAAAKIRFEFGIGAQYFVEICKFRVLENCGPTSSTHTNQKKTVRMPPTYMHGLAL